MRNKNRKGFTLIELLIVIAIIGILAAVLIPNLLAARARANDTAAQSCARSIATAQEVVNIDTNAYGENMGALDPGMVSGCGADAISVGDGGTFESGWTVTHSGGSGAVYTVTPGGLATGTGGGAPIEE